MLGYALIVALGAIALVQAIAGLGLIPFGLRLLARNSSTRKRAKTLGGILAAVNVTALGLAGATYALMLFTNTFHRYIQVGLAFGVALPIALYAIFSLVLAFIMTRAAAASQD
jgi:hypothetical protein